MREKERGELRERGGEREVRMRPWGVMEMMEFVEVVEEMVVWW